jgi:hypothetical protein
MIWTSVREYVRLQGCQPWMKVATYVRFISEEQKTEALASYSYMFYK